MRKQIFCAKGEELKPFIFYQVRFLHDESGRPVLLELRSHKLATISDVIKSLGTLRGSFEDFITYSQYAAVKYKVIAEYMPVCTTVPLTG
jgi:hypothetical protein